MNDKLAILILLISLMTALYLIIVAGFSGRKASALIRARAELQSKLLDRLGTGREVVDFCQTQGGKQFMEALCLSPLDSPAASKGSLPDRILGSVQKGIILTLLGLGFLLLAEKFQRDAGDLFMVIGTVGLSLGIGFLLSAGASYRLSRSMGILADRTPAND